MADGRDIKCWDDHAQDCEAEGREPFVMSLPEDEGEIWLRKTLLSLEGVHKCLDLGCGPCYWINLFEGFEYNGFDQSPGMLQVANKQLTKNGLIEKAHDLRQGNARNLQESYAEGTFDLVFSSAVLQHNRHEPDKREIVQGMHYIIRPGGYYLCTENTFRPDNAPQWADNDGTCDGYSFTPTGWKNWMARYGFEMLDFNGQSDYLYRRI